MRLLDLPPACRSPWSNTYDPPVEAEDGEEAFVPPAELRTTEVAANELLSIYGTQYYGSGAVTSAYLWDQDGGSIAGCFLVRKGEWFARVLNRSHNHPPLHTLPVACAKNRAFASRCPCFPVLLCGARRH